jgi:hypothetical protein
MEVVNVKKIICFLILIATAAATSASGQISVSAQVDTGRDIYVGDNFGFYIVITGADNPGQVDLGPLQEFNPQSTGNKRQSSTNIINNKVNTTTTTIMTYSLTANRIGQMQIPSVTVTVDGKTYRTNPLTINVIKPGTTELLDLEMLLADTQCYVGEPVVLTVNFYVGANIGDFQLNVPPLTSDDFYVEDSDIKDPQAKDFQLNNGIRISVSQYQVTHNSKNYTLVTFNKVLIPKKAGKIQLEPATVSAEVAVGRTSSRDRLFDDFFGSNIQYKRFMVGSEPLELNVLPVPDEDKPSEFYGLIGKYTISASATPTQVNVGDPITLTVKIGGGKYLKPVQWPALEKVPALAANFRIPSQKASPIIENGFKVFTQTIRANNDSVTEIPPIPLAYFDTARGQYATAKTEPIKLEVAPTKVLTNADLESADFAPVNKEVEAIKKGLSANYEGPDVLENMNFSPVAALLNPGYALLWAAPLAGLILSSLIRLSTHTSDEKIAARRRRQACGKAIGQLKRINPIDANLRNETLVSTMKQYIGDRFDRTAGSLTPDDCYNQIFAATADEQAAHKFKETMAEFEATRYASMETKITPEKIKEVIELVRNIEKKSKNA